MPAFSARRRRTVCRDACLCIAGFGFFSVYASWALPTALLSGTSAAAGIAAINSIGNLGGYFGPQVFGLLKDRTGGETAGLVFFAACALVGAGIVMVVGHDRSLERAPDGAGQAPRHPAQGRGVQVRQL